MDASRNETIKTAFVLRAENVSALNKLVREFLRSNATVSFNLTCKDGMERHPADVKAVANYDNTDKNEIIRLAVTGISEDRTRHCTVTLSSDSFWANIRVTATGGEQSVTTLYDNLTSLIQTMSPWYGRLATINFIALFSTIIGVLGAILFVLSVAVSLYLGEPENLVKGDGRSLFIVVCVFAYALAAGEALNWVRGKLFPLTVFALGTGVRRHENSDWWRKLAISTVFIGGVLVGGLVNFVVNAAMK